MTRFTLDQLAKPQAVTESAAVNVQQNQNPVPQNDETRLSSRFSKAWFYGKLIYLLMCLWYLGQFTSPFLLLTMIYPSWFSIICNLTGFILTGSYLKCTNTIAKSMKKQRSLLVKYGFLAAHWNVMTIGSAMLIYLCRKNPDAFSRNVSKPHECPSYNALISLVLFTFAVDFVTYKILVAFLAYHNVLVANPQTTTTDDPEPLLSQS